MMNPQFFILTIVTYLLSMHATAQNMTDDNTTMIPTTLTPIDTTMLYTTLSPIETTIPFPSSEPTSNPTAMPTSNPITAISTTMIDTTTMEPTQEPTIEPTYYPTIDPTTSPTVPEEDIIEIEITLTLTLQDNNATEEEIKEIIIDIMSEFIDTGFKIIDVIIISRPSSARRRLMAEAQEIEVTVVVGVKDEETANEVKETVESEEFADALETELVEAGGGTASVAATAEIVEDEEETVCDIIWWQPWAWGNCANILLWILLAAVGCIFCIIMICFIRCCYLCCSKTRGRTRGQSKYMVGKAMFGRIDNNAESDNAFQADLKSAIEMNKKGSFLKKTGSSLDLDDKAVAEAFDMDFDEIKPINRKDDTPDAIVRVQSEVEEKEKDKDSKNGAKSKDKKKKKGKESEAEEGLLPETTTPGGPTPGGPDDDEDNPPPAPAPPAQAADLGNVEDYDLL